jgi:carboxyl-terminal processing protease
LWSTVDENYYDPHFMGTDWASVGERYRQRARAVETDEQFRTLASEMLAEIPSSHLHIRTPANNTEGFGIGAQRIAISGMEVVYETAPLSDARRKGLRAGDRLISSPATLRGELGSTATIEIERCNGEREHLNVRREGAYWPPEQPGFSWSRIRPNATTQIGYMRITRFGDRAAELADAAMSDLADTQALIIDVRDNSGGNVSYFRLGSYFGHAAEPVAALFSRPYLQALGRPLRKSDIAAAPKVSGVYTTAGVFEAMVSNNGGALFWTEDPPYRYERPVYVLIGEDTGSAAEGFAWYMRLHTDAMLIGRQTAGALLSSDNFPIGDGWSVTVPVHNGWGADGEDYADRAVPPHVEIERKREDLCSGQDSDLAKAMSLAIGR